MIEPEIAFADLTDDINLAEDFIKYMIRAAFERLPDEMGIFSTSASELAWPSGCTQSQRLSLCV